jgi:hypothetical protein
LSGWKFKGKDAGLSTVCAFTWLIVCREVIKVFPSIQVLDQQPIQVLAEPVLPIPVAGNFFDSPSSSSTAQAFVEKVCIVRD